MNQSLSPALPSPGFTPVPDALMDLLLPELGGTELKVLLYLMRRTLGFAKQEDTVSIRRIAYGHTTREGKLLDRGVGLSPRTVQRALQKLQRLGLIHIQPSGHGANRYTMSLFSPLSPMSAPSPESSLREAEPPSPCPAGHTPLSHVTPPPLSHVTPNNKQIYQKTDKHHHRGDSHPPVADDAHRGFPPEERDDVSFSQEQKLHDTPHSVASSGVDGPQEEDIRRCAEELLRRGISPAAARHLVERYGTRRVMRQVELFDALRRSGSPLISANPPGYLRRAIEEDYPMPPLLARAREARESEERARRRIAEEGRSRQEELQRRSRLDSLRQGLSPGERASLRQEAMERLAERGADLHFGREIQIRLEEDRILQECMGASRGTFGGSGERGQTETTTTDGPGDAPHQGRSPEEVAKWRGAGHPACGDTMGAPELKSNVSFRARRPCWGTPSSHAYRGERVAVPP